MATYQPYQPYQGRYCCRYRRRRSKQDWAGVGLGDAFRQNLDYYLRLTAQQLFYRAARKVQAAVAAQTGVATDGAFAPKAKPQLGPCYTNYPSTLAARAAIGLTGFLEYKERVKEKILFTHLGKYLENPAEQDDVRVDPGAYQQLAVIVADCVQTRLLLDDLSRLPSAGSIEIYRLFSASQETLQFRTVPEIVKAVILYGDVLPDWQGLDLHPATRAMLLDVTAVSIDFFDRLASTPPERMVQLGASWVRAVCRRLAKYIPPPEEEDSRAGQTGPGEGEQEDDPEARYRFRQGRDESALSDRIAPLSGPRPPSLFDPSSAAEEVANALVHRQPLKKNKESGQAKPGSALNDQLSEILAKFAQAVDRAGAQQATWEDMRSDLVERALRISAFGESPIQGNPADGHSVTLHLGKDVLASGEIFDRPVELSDDLPAYEALFDQSRPIVEELRRALYPNLTEVPETERFRTSGSLDPSRLHLADFAPAVFRRYRIHERADRRGQPVLLIACDGSGSLSSDQIKMLKILCCAWLSSTARSGIQVLAGLYHSGTIRPGVSGPLVQWMYHPQKTPTTSRRDAARALVSLPSTGTGVQSDALSLAFMMNEATRLARGKMVYLILISDCCWNTSFNTPKGGKEEVYSYFQTAYEEFPGKLHVTLVALGVAAETGFESLLERVITVSTAELQDSAAVAERIGIYVASCMKERNRWLAGR